MKINPNDPAMPCPSGYANIKDYHPGYGEFTKTVEVSQPGVTIRAEFAKAAMAALIQTWGEHDNEKMGNLTKEQRKRMFARDAVEMADAPIAELNKEEA